MSRETLARTEAAKLAASDLPVGPCAGHGDRWAQLEAAHRRARTPDQARTVIEYLRSTYCSGCPALLGCGDLAQVSSYTGLAAGVAYERGERQDITWTVHKPRRQKSAG